jgi:hypothetical protein
MWPTAIAKASVSEASATTFTKPVDQDHPRQTLAEISFSEYPAV